MNQFPTNSSRMLSSAAYSETVIPSLRLARSSQFARKIGKMLFTAMIVMFLVVTVSPWQQSVKGTGGVIAYAPEERQQVLQSPIKGRLQRLGEGIVENAYVTEGQLIAEIADIDASYLERLQNQEIAVQSQLKAAENYLSANKRNLETSKTIVESYESQLRAYRQVKEQVVASAEASVKSARNKIEAESQQLIEHQTAMIQLQADFERQRKLYEEDYASEYTFQSAERKYNESTAKIAKSKAYVAASKNDLQAKINDREAKAQKAQVDIDYAEALLKKSKADVSKAESEVAKAQAELNKTEKFLLEIQTKVSRQLKQKILAPFNGYVTRITPNQGSQILKQGDPICVIVPESSRQAVQLWVDGNDVPLIVAGRHVRLQFEGWPAVQFAGWPSVAVGTFGGEIVSVDAADNGKGKFRVIVLPDDESQEWPTKKYLRQGVRANGWVLLDQVPLWYEIWRTMNGFPPTSAIQTEEKKEKPPVPKL